MARWLIALVIALISLITYFGSTSTNPLTGEKQRVALKPEQEIALGLKQQLTQGLIGAAVVGTGDYSTAQIGQVVGSLIHMRYGRDDELESDAS